MAGHSSPDLSLAQADHLAIVITSSSSKKKMIFLFNLDFPRLVGGRAHLCWAVRYKIFGIFCKVLASQGSGPGQWSLVTRGARTLPQGVASAPHYCCQNIINSPRGILYTLEFTPIAANFPVVACCAPTMSRYQHFHQRSAPGS